MLRVAQVGLTRAQVTREPAEALEALPTLRDVAAASASAGVEVLVVQAATRDAVVEQGGVRYTFVEDSGRIALLPGPSRGRLRLPRRTIETVLALHPDVVHVNGLTFPVATRALGRHLGASRVLVQDHGSRASVGLRRLLDRWGFADIGAAAFTARAQADPFFRAGVFRPGLPVFEVLESSTYLTPLDRPVARARTGLRGDPCFLWLGHLDANKDPLAVLEAVSRAAPSLADPQMWCCFKSAPLLAEVEQRIATDPNLHGRVHLLGRRPHADIPVLLSAADFLVQASHFEGSGYAVLEALACGTPPLVTDIPSLRRITGGGTVGALSPPGDVHAMARAIVDWSERDRTASRAAARAHFDRALSFAVVGRELRAAYEQLVARQ